ncbi:hypothetical protein HBI56_037630 [Parastagonospora nodorum]|uniref:Uncharacterized protein n=1 Tax=Phaeosphaeria nodorum (strain SN15 / ATCC MYA-4574 / FGSC 10173) TaxID=321614 RepID=A0A7U2EV48_PHANO|nr:hypothetical protein HBH56_069170 [Parastagonospora nodorum]QRC93564.1 hypothetical protein JI435_404080 [Parastagonospora nodorum SN15]KAH3932313.1 hypothetical protein HBH54_078950 [Parastagonospora nodorum]KAH3954634.1 hypothetical protein HBH53_015410 [Parastagonospora nodorum]KAH3986385.1 hypothetical protein HBH52_046570 [Parastagonospora nodorum]
MATNSTGHRRRVSLSPVRIFILRSYPRCNRLRSAHCQTFWEFRFFQPTTRTQTPSVIFGLPYTASKHSVFLALQIVVECWHVEYTFTKNSLHTF